MEYRLLGRTGVSVSPLCLGTMMFGPWGNDDRADAIRVIHRALDAGINFVDTADVYSGGVSEEITGEALQGRRDEVVLATKFFMPMDDRPNHSGGSRKWIMQEAENSLRRLKTDYIDLYQVHRPSATTDVEETLGALTDLVRQGKVRYIGLSEASVPTIRRAHKVHPITAVQTEYSLWTRDPEDGLLEALRTLDIGFVAYSPLGRGFLTGQIKRIDDLAADDFRRTHPRFTGENFQKNLDLVARVEEIAREQNCTPAQLALAWVLAQGDDIVPIPGTRHPERVEENLHSLDIVLSENDLRRIDTAAPKGVAAGERYSEGGMKSING